ncbi:glycerophosphodiester phosphodiesterase family protein [Halobacillus amylolyticus]|uniref:Glycerophosphodiester phosphodiesterase n=1 Tax=Halobacillus amylolyticus TaxID=2932259 RepID=A0ABY4HAT1_9BACI|nr:glycerophosphodiester phosphodiesterase family protein [Halobacillus amylolyticus]UOR11656.1 glycerophosphodiester phosphodiesterase [Halobacillus amylolyticus]
MILLITSFFVRQDIAITNKGMYYKIMITLMMVLNLLNLFNDVEVYAHRGASTIAPEHTIDAYDEAINYGADYIEIDLRMTKDNHIVALHDQTVDRTTDGEGYISNLTLEEVKRLDAGSWFSPKYEGSRVPTLSEIFNRYGNSIKYYIETRVVNNKAVMEDDVQNIIKKYNVRTENIMFQSWYESSLMKIDDKYKRIKLYAEPFSKINIEHTATYADGIANEAKYYDRLTLVKLRLLDLESHAFFYEKEHKMTGRMKQLGVDGIFTNYVQYQP